MIAAKYLPLPVSPPSRNAGHSSWAWRAWWVRWAQFGAAMKAAWRLRFWPLPVQAGKPADIAAVSLPVAGKIVAITVTGGPARLARKATPGVTKLAPPQKGAARPGAVPAPALARRPGVQGRWKANDRVPML